MSTASKEAEAKLNFPWKFCPAPKCLWRTDGNYCPRHKPAFPPDKDPNISGTFDPK